MMQPPPPDNRYRILLVDDTPDNIHVLMDTLRDDYILSVARNGEKALALVVQSPPPDLVLLDIMMPGIDGYEVCRRIKKDPRTRDIPVLFITALDEVQDEARGLGMGAADYIAKPFNPELVKARVRIHLSLRAAVQKLEDQSQRLALANNDLRSTVLELKELGEQRSEFLGIAVHDLKNPLSAIMGFAQLLHLHASDPDQTSVPREKCAMMLEQIRDSSAHMYDLINSLLDSELIETGKLRLEKQPTDLGELATQITDINRQTAERKRIELLLEQTRDCVAVVDRQRMREIMDNLVSNAIKFSPTDRRVWITVFNTEGGQPAFSVRDEGPGFTAQDKERVYGRFEKLSARPTGGENSSGLGLSIVKRLVEMHDGTIDIESEPGDGTTFTVHIPRDGE